MKTLVIAEPGCTAEGDYRAMVRLLETAHQCGADVWKPQWTSDPAQMCERRHIPTDHPKRHYYEKAYAWLNWPVEWHGDFRNRCRVFGMKYACTAFLPADVFTIEPYVDYVKIASFEAGDEAIRTACKYVSKPVLLSTGMTSYLEVDLLLKSTWQLLHCVSSYPAPASEMNLRVLSDGGYGRYAGLSDHSKHLLTGALAVARGARFIEAHYRLDDCDPSNPDYGVAFTPAEFAEYIQNIRTAESMMGDGIKRQQRSEAWALPYRVMP